VALLSSGDRTTQSTFVTTSDILNESSVNADVAGFQRANYQIEERDTTSDNGSFSNVWDFRSNSIAARVSCDHPFCGWHDLRICYRGVGWRVMDTRIDRTNPEWPAVQVRLTKVRNGTHAILFFSLFGADGEPAQPPEEDHTAGLFQNRIVQGGLYGVRADTLQCQTFAVLGVPFSEGQIDSLRRLHLDSRQQIRNEATQIQVAENQQ
jgi:hypothetical protein